MENKAGMIDPLYFKSEDGTCNEINMLGKNVLVSKSYLAKLKGRLSGYYRLAYKRMLRVNNLIDKLKELRENYSNLESTYNKLKISYNNTVEQCKNKDRTISDLRYELSLVYEQYEITNYHLGALYDQYDIAVCKHEPFVNSDRHLRNDKVVKILEVYDGNMSLRVLQKRLADEHVKVSLGYLSKFVRELKESQQ